LIPIIIINWNCLEHTVECIDSVLRLKGCDFTIHIIDNGSDNFEGIKLKQKFAKFKNLTVHLYTKNYGFAKAHIKIWIELFRDNPDIKYIALLNNDTVVDKYWLKELTIAAKNGEYHIISSKMIYYYDHLLLDSAGHKMLNTGEIIPIGHGERSQNYMTDFENMGACAGACLYSTEMIKKIGFFDPKFNTGYEDAEFGLRAVIYNYKCKFASNAIVFHKIGTSVKKVFDIDYNIMIQSSIFYSYFKLMPKAYLILNLPFLILKYFAIFIIDIIFIRPKYLKIQIIAIKNTWDERRQIINVRCEHNKKLKKLNWYALMKRTNFFIWFDIKRFYHQIILNKKSNIKEYNKL